MRKLLIAILVAGCSGVPSPEVCPELAFDDGTPSGRTFHANVSNLMWHPPAFPPPSRDPANFGGAVAFSVVKKGLMVAGVAGGKAWVHEFPDLHGYAMSVAAGHERLPGSGCTEVLALAASGWQLASAGCDAQPAVYDGGGISDAARYTPGVGWSPAGAVAAIYDSHAQSCDEGSLPSCLPPQGTGPQYGGSPVSVQSVDALTGADGGVTWAVSANVFQSAMGVLLYPSDFSGDPAVVVPPRGRVQLSPVTQLEPGLGLVAASVDFANSQFVLNLFDASGADAGNSTVTFGPVTTVPRFAHFGAAPGPVQVAWVSRADNLAYTATVDLSTPERPVVSTPRAVCGSYGASFVAPMTDSVTLLQVADGLYLRPR